MSRLFKRIAVPILSVLTIAVLVAGPLQKMPPPEQVMDMKNATGPAREVLQLQQRIEAAVVSGDAAFAGTVLSGDFHFRHGDGWTRGEKTGGIEDDRTAFLRRIADREYLVHDLDQPKIEMHGDVAITWGRYVSLFMPKTGKASTPPGLLNLHQKIGF